MLPSEDGLLGSLKSTLYLGATGHLKRMLALGRISTGILSCKGNGYLFCLSLHISFPIIFLRVPKWEMYPEPLWPATAKTF